ALPAGSGVEFLSGGAMYARPSSAIRAYRKLLKRHVGAGAGQIRIIGEMPVAALGSTWDWWARYESAINHAYDDFPLWSMCAYDTRIASTRVLDDGARPHPGGGPAGRGPRAARRLPRADELPGRAAADAARPGAANHAGDRADRPD